MTLKSWCKFLNSCHQDGSIQNKDKQKGVIEFDKDQASSSKGKHSMQAKLPTLHFGNKEKLASNKWRQSCIVQVAVEVNYNCHCSYDSSLYDSNTKAYLPSKRILPLQKNGIGITG